MASNPKKQNRPDRTADHEPKEPAGLLKHPVLSAAGAYALIACALTFPLIFRLNSSVYGFYDHISTDLFASIHYYFWWMRESLGSMTSPLVNPLFNYPFGARMFLANFTGFVMAPVSLALGHLASYNLVILGNLVLSGLGMFLLVRHLTRSVAAGFVAGVVYAFCPNMLVRSYTTFDSTQVQWIPFYTLYVIRFMEDRTWKSAILAGVFLAANILIAMPYYLVYLPIHTIVLLAAYTLWTIWGGKAGAGGFFRGLITPDAIRAWGRIAAVFAAVVVVFGLYYTQVVGGGDAMTTGREGWSTGQLANYTLQARDFLVPHPRSALFKGNFKETYWDAQQRFEKNADSDVAYIGYLALILALIGIWKGRGPARWFFFAGAVIAFWATLGPQKWGLPTPSGLIYTFAPFARRILLYKTFVQFGMAGLAGLGGAFLFARMKKGAIYAAVGISVLMLGEYAVVPPFLSVNLAANPEVYKQVKELPEKSALIEVPMKRAGGNLYQGYVYYQTVHQKPIFNPYADMSLSRVPERIRPFYRQMETPLEAGQYANLAALRWLGVTHLAYHIYIGTATVRFLSYGAPDLDTGKVEGLRCIYQCPRSIDGPYDGPYDYTFADLHEITAQPCPVALVFDAPSPFDKTAGWTGQDGMLPYGMFSALMDTSRTFSYPVWNGSSTERVMRGAGRITAVNLSDKPVNFDLSFTARAGDTRDIEVRWNGAPVAKSTVGPEPASCAASGFSLPAGGTGEISLAASGAIYQYALPVGKEQIALPALAAVSDVRATVK